MIININHQSAVALKAMKSLDEIPRRPLGIRTCTTAPRLSLVAWRVLHNVWAKTALLFAFRKFAQSPPYVQSSGKGSSPLSFKSYSPWKSCLKSHFHENSLVIPASTKQPFKRILPRCPSEPLALAFNCTYPYFFYWLIFHQAPIPPTPPHPSLNESNIEKTEVI